MKQKINIGLRMLLFVVIVMQAQFANALSNEKIEGFRIHDGIGIGMTITAMSVVFCCLVILYLAFKLIGKISVHLGHRRAMIFSGLSHEEAKEVTERSGELFAAIAMAIYEATELHDEENTILTIKNKASAYSPWNSKIYTLREVPVKK
ncbi:MAG: OadG family protein [Dysgonamonadaceae bacterium]|jgi:Na+-transporting methylmalonyl-CoA/oxaloacetate decarboxylase gamma subunit|nr:OadG family protein [Dysgonamonadaceae bacterium]